MSPDRLRVLIADDHPVFRFGLRALLQAEPDMELVGEAGTGEEAIVQAAALRPDVVLMDLNMPRLNGVEATRRILRLSPGIAVLVLSMLEDAESIFAAMRAGARGYVLKGAGGTETLQAIRIVGSGGAIFGPAVAQQVLQYFASARAGGAHVQVAGALLDLTEREREVLTLIAQGCTNAAIADRLVLSPKTVRNYVSDIFGKLQVTDRVQAVLRAREAGLG